MLRSLMRAERRGVVRGFWRWRAGARGQGASCRGHAGGPAPRPAMAGPISVRWAREPLPVSGGEAQQVALFRPRERRAEADDALECEGGRVAPFEDRLLDIRGEG